MPDSLGFKLALCAMVCVAAFTIDVSVPAIPEIGNSYGISAGDAQFIVGSYLLGFTLGQIPVGLLSDKYGRLPILLAGLVIFLLSSLLCIFATSSTVLFASRFAQGVSGAVGPVISRSIARDVKSGVELAKYMGMLISALGLSTLIAPVIGSYLVGFFGWQSPFIASFVLGLLVLSLTLMYVKETQLSKNNNRLLSSLKRAFVAFMTSGESLKAGLILGFSFFGFMAFVATFTTVLSEVYHIKAAYLGVIFAIPISTYLLGSWVFRRVVTSLSVAGVLKITILIFAVESVLFILVAAADNVSLLVLCLLMVPYFLAFGMAQPCLMMMGLESMGAFAGAGASILGTTQILFGTAGAAVSALLYSGGSDSLLLIMAISMILMAVVYISFAFRNKLHLK